MPLICRRVVVSGRVQGVGFRWHTRERAAELGLVGWVQNLADGRVEALIQGEEEAVRSMISWLEKGPPAARVSGVQVAEHEPQGMAVFDVRRRW